MPAHHGLWTHDGDGAKQSWKDLGDGGDGPPVTRLEARPRCASLKHDDLLAEQSVLGDQLGTPTDGNAHQAEAGFDELTKHCQEP